MNTENSKKNESYNFRLKLADKLNLEDPNRNMALASFSIYYAWKNIKSAYNITNLKSLLQLGMMNLIYLMDHSLFQTFQIFLGALLKNMRI